MALHVNRLVTIATFIISLAEFGSPFRVVTNPQPYSRFTETLNISCIADQSSDSEKTIISIQFIKNGEDKTIAIVDLTQKLKIEDGMKDNIKAQGHIDDTKSGKSYLTLTIDKPAREDAGIYRCQVFFRDENYQMVEENVVGNVTYEDPDIITIVADNVGKISSLMTTVSEQKKTIKTQGNQIVTLKDKLSKQEQNIDTLMDLIETQNQTIQRHEKLFQKLEYLTRCPEGWTFYKPDETCLKAFGKEDRWEEQPWSKARELCQTLDGDLVQIHDEAKNTFVIKMFGEKAAIPWIGVRNEAKTGFDFKYVDGTDLGTYQPWTSGAPTGGSEGQYYKCVSVFTSTYRVGQWVDGKCNVPDPYVCSISVRKP